MNEIMQIAGKYGIPVIEDAAEALGSKYQGKPLGTFGDIGILSFNGNKIITTSGGGALISDNEEFIKQARFLSTQARDKAAHYQHSQIGFNYRMSNVLAGIGRGQLKVIEDRVSKRRSNFEYYFNNLNELHGISFLSEKQPFFSNRWLTTILVDSALTGNKTREDIRIEMGKFNIETRPLWKPMHLQPIFEHYPQYVNGVSENLFNLGLCLPSGSNLSRKDLDRVISHIKHFFS